MKTIKIGERIIGDNCEPYIIAEMSGNHNKSLDRAFKIVEEAAKAGAHAIKLQTYTPDTMTIPNSYIINDETSLWHGRELFELYKDAFTPWEWHEPIFNYAKKLGIQAFSTPFDESAVDFLTSLNVDAFKIASFENTDLPLLKKVANTGKPIIMSTGAATLSDIDEAVRVLKNNGCVDLVLLKCTSTYPASAVNTNLLTIPQIRDNFDCLVGLSDHTLGVGVGIASVALGACVIEKHFTINRADGGVDSAFSIEPSELKTLVLETKNAFLALGDIQFGIQDSEKNNLIFKRSLYVVKDIKEGEKFTSENIRVIRPGFGLPPKLYDMVINRYSKSNILAGTPLTWDLI